MIEQITLSDILLMAIEKGYEGIATLEKGESDE